MHQLNEKLFLKKRSHSSQKSQKEIKEELALEQFKNLEDMTEAEKVEWR